MAAGLGLCASAVVGNLDMRCRIPLVESGKFRLAGIHDNILLPVESPKMEGEAGKVNVSIMSAHDPA